MRLDHHYRLQGRDPRRAGAGRALGGWAGPGCLGRALRVLVSRKLPVEAGPSEPRRLCVDRRAAIRYPHPSANNSRSSRSVVWFGEAPPRASRRRHHMAEVAPSHLTRCDCRVRVDRSSAWSSLPQSARMKRKRAFRTSPRNPRRTPAAVIGIYGLELARQ